MKTVSLLLSLKLMSLARSVIVATVLAALGATPTSAQTTAGEPVTIGVSGPLTGPNAQYGAQWKKGFDLAHDELNAKGGVKGRPLQYVFEDSQADPRQTIAIAQKFVSDPKIVVEVGDFSSTASMAASPIYRSAIGSPRSGSIAMSRLRRGMKNARTDSFVSWTIKLSLSFR